MVDLEELHRLLSAATPGPWNASLSGYSVRCVEGYIVCAAQGAEWGVGQMVANQELIAAMRNALPALLDGYEAGRQREAEVAEFLRAGVPPVPVGDGKEMVFRAPSLKMAMQMLATERDIEVEAIRRSRDEYADRAHRFERAAYAGRKLREAIRCGYCVDAMDKCAACKALAEYDAAVGVE